MDDYIVNGFNYGKLQENGQYERYPAPTFGEAEFIRPVRTSYIHTKCGAQTVMSRGLAETYARKPTYYGYTFCVGCRQHYPVGEFTWDETDIVVGT